MRHKHRGCFPNERRVEMRNDATLLPTRFLVVSPLIIRPSAYTTERLIFEGRELMSPEARAAV